MHDNENEKRDGFVHLQEALTMSIVRLHEARDKFYDRCCARLANHRGPAHGRRRRRQYSLTRDALRPRRQPASSVGAVVRKFVVS